MTNLQLSSIEPKEIKIKINFLSVYSAEKYSGISGIQKLRKELGFVQMGLGVAGGLDIGRTQGKFFTIDHLDPR